MQIRETTFLLLPPVYEANKVIATGKAVIVCPGGGFYFLLIGNEGRE
jgi:hypothetical protein